MAENDNAKIIERAYQAFGRGDLPAMLGLLSSDIAWRHPAIEGVPWAASFRGTDSVAGFFAALAKAADVEQFEPLHFVAAGDRVVVLGRERVRAKSTGRTYETDWAHSFLLRDGKIVEFQEYTDTNRIAAAFREA